MRFKAILFKEWVIFKNTFASTTLGMAVGPLLYLIAFGWGLSGQMGGYAGFVVPGVIAMNSMSVSFGYIANDINLARTYMKTFEAVMISPVSMAGYAVSRILVNTLRSLYSVALICLAAWAFGSAPKVDLYFALIVALNCLVFSAIGFIAGILVNTHAGMAKITNFVITPMSFLCGTFFPLDRFPRWLGGALSALPLTQAVNALRDGYSVRGAGPALCLAAYVALLVPSAVILCKRAE
jgi:ABC-type multidrug transport system permease subunit